MCIVINKVICVCSQPDGETFQIATSYIQKYIPANKYVTIVPNADLDYFNSLDLGEFVVESEDKYNKIADLLRGKKLGSRYGWYFQQFIKMAELDDGQDEDVNLIWDADTVPINDLEFIQDGKLFFYQGSEHHRPYFELQGKLLGYGKVSNTSFIAQCLPYRAGWFRHFQLEFEKTHGKSWYEYVIELIDPKVYAGFSEYETLGSYALKHFEDGMILCDRTDNWFRRGNSLLGGPSNLRKYDAIAAKRFDFLSFEKTDRKRFSKFSRFKTLVTKTKPTVSAKVISGYVALLFSPKSREVL